MPAAAFIVRDSARASADSTRRVATSASSRILITFYCVLFCFVVIAGQLVRLALRAGAEAKVSLAEPLAQNWARPDIVDRHGRLLATDVVGHSLYADPQAVLDLDDLIDRLADVLPGLDKAELRKTLGDKSRRFAWVMRGLSPRQAQSVHELGLPALAFRAELKRVYPLGSLAGHVLGFVNVDNKGLAGIERALDETSRVEAVHGAGRTLKPPVRLSLDIGVQHAVADELRRAANRYGATGAAGLVLDIGNGEVLAAVSLPETHPDRPASWLETARIDRLAGGSYELGSIFKVLTVAMALETGIADLEKTYDVRQPLTAGPYTIKDLYPQGRPLSVREILLHSSNVGAGMLALEAGAERQRAFLARLGLLDHQRTEAGGMAAPQLPKTWGRIETITISYGHGLSVAPLQFAAAVAGLLNGGRKVTPTFWLQREDAGSGQRMVSAATSAKIRELLRLNVTTRVGTGRRAEADGYRVGGKTGTAEMPGRGGYQEKSVISSFVGAFPMDAPRYLTLVMLFEPRSGEGPGNRITAGVNAAPATARVISRIAPMLGVLPRLVETRLPATSTFDAPTQAQ